MSRMKFIAVCVPSLGQVSLEWAAAFRDLQLPNNVGIVRVFVKDEVGGEIAEARNRCVSLALGMDSDRIEITHLFWLDDDVICTPLALIALHHKNVDIASGVYFTKSEFSTPLIYPGRIEGHTPFAPDQCFETWGHGMGLCLIKVGVYRRMKDELALKNDKYGNSEWYRKPNFEDTEVDDKAICTGGTEDLYFLHRAGGMGYKPLVDTGKWAFGWHFDSRAQKGYPLEQWGQFSKQQPVLWPTPDGPKEWK